MAKAMHGLKNDLRWARHRIHFLLPGFLRGALRARRLRGGMRWQAEIQKIVDAYPERKARIVFLPSLTWKVEGGQLFQRPQQLALALARAGALIFYLEQGEDHRSPVFELVEPGLYLGRVPTEAFWNFPSFWQYALTWNLPFLRGFEPPNLIYDYVDELNAFGGDRRILEFDHRNALVQAQLVLATSQKLLAQARQVRTDALFCPNGVDYAHFAPCRTLAVGTPPADWAARVPAEKPVAGYYGALARWFDYQLLDELAQKRPEITFVLIGSDHDQTLASSGVLRRPNIVYLGVKPYAALPDYLRFFDAAMIPFKLNDITHATSPLKLFEYMAAGKPVVLTPMEESCRYPGVLVAATADEFSQKLDEAFTLAHSAPYIEKITGQAQQNTWTMRAEQILGALEKNEKTV